MNTRKLIAGALGAALMASALPGLVLAQDEEAGFAAEGVDWVLDTMNGEVLSESAEVTLTLSGGQASGSAGCNSYSGGYEIDETSLSFLGPFGATLMACADELMAVEEAYLPLLQATAGWSVDEEGMLSLTDADGAVTLVYSEPPVDITGSDIDALVMTLDDLQTQIDQATADLARIVAATETVDVDKLDKRITKLETSVEQLEKRVGEVNVVNLKKRVTANEEAVATNATKIGEINKTLNKLRTRIVTLEETAADHEQRIAALEGAPAATPAP